MRLVSDHLGNDIDGLGTCDDCFWVMTEQHRIPVFLQDHCAECGFDVSRVTPNTAVEVVRTLAERYKTTLSALNAENDDALRQRWFGPTWSALEYAAHVRDVIALWGWGLHRTLIDHEPELPRPEPGVPDRVAEDSGYNRQDPFTVMAELLANADRMARKMATIEMAQWQRSAHFGELRISALDIVRKVAHEEQHHLLDIERCLGTSAR